MNCPYCDADASRASHHRGYFDCESGHTFHEDDWDEELREGVTV